MDTEIKDYYLRCHTRTSEDYFSMPKFGTYLLGKAALYPLRSDRKYEVTLLATGEKRNIYGQEMLDWFLEHAKTLFIPAVLMRFSIVFR